MTNIKKTLKELKNENLTYPEFLKIFCKNFNLKIIDEQNGYTTSHNHVCGDELEEKEEDGVKGANWNWEYLVENSIGNQKWIDESCLLNINIEGLVNSDLEFFKQN